MAQKTNKARRLITPRHWKRVRVHPSRCRGSPDPSGGVDPAAIHFAPWRRAVSRSGPRGNDAMQTHRAGLRAYDRDVARRCPRHWYSTAAAAHTGSMAMQRVLAQGFAAGGLEHVNPPQLNTKRTIAGISERVVAIRTARRNKRGRGDRMRAARLPARKPLDGDTP